MTRAQRGQIWEFTLGSGVQRGLVISTDQHNQSQAWPWLLLIMAARTPAVLGFAVRLDVDDPIDGDVRINRVAMIDPTALRRPVGFLSAASYARVEYLLRDFLELP